MEKQVRLPPYIKPERYKLLVKPDLENFKFEGKETISLVLNKATSSIILHAKELAVTEVWYLVFGIKYQARKIRYDKKAERATFIFRKKLPRGRGELSLKFKGILNDKMRGFYRSRYIHQGKEKHIATTQFEATDARSAFPCFDEPAQKAVFDITVMVPPGLTAISNTIETSIKEHEGGYRAVQFTPTPRMSTYLLAFIVGDFEYIEGKTRDGIAIRVFVTPGKKHQAKFALDCAIKTLEFYNRYFDIPYPLPILDLIAIPDFSHGAMENWGAVTYRESALLVDPVHSSASNKQWVALVIAHELAHQWFGNLVTMHWWTDLWLNEGFASYIEYLAVDHIFPGWDIWTQFSFNDLGVALKLDALKSTHPIEAEVGHPDEIGEIFDEVSYSKGASIIRMLAGYLGETDFRNGLRKYLKKHSYANAKTEDLWKAFEDVSKKPVKEIMQNWTKEPGYPLIRIVDGPKNYKLVQSRFFSSPISKKQSKDETVWQIPFKVKSGPSASLRTGKLKVESFLQRSKKLNVRKNERAWTKFNLGETSLIRVDYPAQILEKLHEPIKKKQLSTLDRLGIIRDAFALAESGDLPTTQALELLQAYKNETDYTVWVEVLSGLNCLNNLLYGQPCHKNFKKFARSILKKIVKHIGWRAHKNEKHTKGLLRSLVLHSAGSFGESATIGRAQYLFGQWMNKNRQIKPDLRGVVYSLSAEYGGRKEQEFLIKRYQNESLHEEKNRLGRALGQFKDTGLIIKSLKFALSGHVRYQDTAGIFSSVWTNPEGRLSAWKFTRAHWKTLLERYPSSGHMLGRFIKPASQLASKKHGNKIKVFFQKHKPPGARRSVEQVLEKIYSNDAWIKRDHDKIERWLKENV
ncbi:MAG: M1 family metallopeptidase [Candidatus Doudnabacteria bacterium]|nr:M1 family metallopeptidase [Candidatus Doudnabacteria bacterium]